MMSEHLVSGTRAKVYDVAQYILDKYDHPLPTMKLQKLVYYSQALHCAALGEPLFDEVIEAWRNGPVVRDLYSTHRRRATVTTIPQGDSGALTESQKGAIDAVIDSFGGLTGWQLSQMTHNEAPWIQAFDGDHEYPQTPIETDVMASYYREKWGLAVGQ